MPIQPFLGEIMYVSFNYPPKGWAFCDGAQLPINQNQALFSLLGTTYGGNGQTTFALPDLRGRAEIGAGPSLPLGTASGSDSVALAIAELPPHAHTVFVGTAAATSATPSGTSVLGSTSGVTGEGEPFAANLYNAAPTPATTLAGAAIGTTGSGQGHENRQPFNTVRACIALNGIFPSRN